MLTLEPGKSTPTGHRARLRQRYLKAGLDGFSDTDVVELLLCLAIPRGDVKPQARELLIRFGTLRKVLDATVAELSAVPGLGEAAVVGLRVVREAGELYLKQKVELGEQFKEFESLSTYWRVKLGGLKHEEFHVAYLDSSHRLLNDGVQALEVGVPDQAAVYPRKVMTAALQKGAVALVFAHNHPSGECQASMQDRQLTRCLQDAARALQMRVLDHLIVAAGQVFSFRKEGLL